MFLVWLTYLFMLHSPFIAGRYHSLVIENESFPSDFLEITAWTEDRLVMDAQHKKYKHIQVWRLVCFLICDLVILQWDYHCYAWLLNKT